MRIDHLKYLRCPKTCKSLQFKDTQLENNRVKSGKLLEPESGFEYPIINFIPRFVPIDNYAKGFGYQWNLHDKTQYDDYSLLNISEKRFFEETKWDRKLSGQLLLEVGSGAGRFTTQAVKTEATVISLDYSSAVEANYKLNGHHENLLIVQGSVYEMPFEREYFDKVLCIGVLQHTPEPQKSFLTLVEYLKPKGSIVTDIYRKSFLAYYTNPKYLIRNFTKGKNPEILYRRIVKWIDFMWPIVKIIRKIDPRISHRLCVMDYYHLLPNASESLLKEWAYLDTFDMLAPAYDLPESIETFKKWHKIAGLENIEVHAGYNGIEGRGTKK